MQDDIKRKGLMSEIVSRLVRLERDVRKLLSASVVQIETGTYTPVVTPIANMTAASALADFTYQKVGNIVTVYGALSAQHDGSGQGEVSISLPVASAFTTSYDCFGVAAHSLTSTQYSGIIRSESINDVALLILSQTVGSTALDWHFSFQYIIK